MPLSTGDKLGPYDILAPLGAGGMGEVYRARDSRLGREVAVKVLREHLANDSLLLARFEREGKAVAALSHPNIVVLFDVGRHEGIHYAVTELLEGETLLDRLGRSPIFWRKTIELGVAMAEGLAAAHSTGYSQDTGLWETTPVKSPYQSRLTSSRFYTRPICVNFVQRSQTMR